MTHEQISVINRILEVDLKCDSYHEDKKTISAMWKKENRPVYDAFNELKEKVRQGGVEIFLRNTEYGFEVTINKAAPVL